MTHTKISKLWLGILVGGGVAATFDIIYACVRNAGHGRSPEWTLQSVASGLLGQKAFESGAGGAALGLFAHYLILLVAAALYVWVARQSKILMTRPFESGALFGIGVYLFMNFIVLPLSAFPFNMTYPFARLAEGFLSHGVLVGLPIAFAARWAVRASRKQT